MGLVRSGNTSLTALNDDRALTDFLWPILREIVKTAIENGQTLVVEGYYIPFDWQKDFAPEYLAHIRYCCLIMSEGYIRAHFSDIKGYVNTIEQWAMTQTASQSASLPKTRRTSPSQKTSGGLHPHRRPIPNPHQPLRTCGIRIQLFWCRVFLFQTCNRRIVEKCRKKMAAGAC